MPHGWDGDAVHWARGKRGLQEVVLQTRTQASYFLVRNNQIHHGAAPSGSARHEARHKARAGPGRLEHRRGSEAAPCKSPARSAGRFQRPSVDRSQVAGRAAAVSGASTGAEPCCNWASKFSSKMC
eukprot:154269-Chlamydomonas_euryale.AAC.5